MTISRKLRRQAYAEAASIVEHAMDGVELPADLSTDEEEQLREYIRTVVVAYIRKRASEDG